MKLGVVFPQIEMGADPGAVRAYGQAVEQIGYHHILAYEHVVGANTASRPGWRGPYDIDSVFHEPFVLFGFLAGLTERIEFATGIVILPQRQTVLVAKQAAALDVLSGGRLRLGIGIGWNAVEYEALGTDFHNRGRRCEEQVALLRALWTERAVTFDGKWHRVTDAGIEPLPVQRPIPLWFGGGEERVLRRIARLADGWMPQFQPDAEGRALLAACTATRASMAATRGNRPQRAHGRRPRRGKRLGRPRAGVAADRRHPPEHRHDAARPAGRGSPHQAAGALPRGSGGSSLIGGDGNGQRAHAARGWDARKRTRTSQPYGH